MPLRTRSGKLTKLGRFERDVDASKLPGGEREKFAVANICWAQAWIEDDGEGAEGIGDGEAREVRWRGRH